MTIVGCEIALLFLWIIGSQAWLHWKKKSIHKEIEEQRRQSDGAFDDLKECVEVLHDGR